MLMFRSLDLERMLINFFLLLKSAIYHSIKLTFDAEVAEKKNIKVLYITQVSSHLMRKLIKDS